MEREAHFRYNSISKLGSAKVLFLSAIFIFLNPKNIAGRSLEPNPEAHNSQNQGTNNELETIVLDMTKIPENVWAIESNHGARKYSRSKQDPPGVQIAVHLKSCNFSKDEFIEFNSFGKEPIRWKCPTAFRNQNSNFNNSDNGPQVAARSLNVHKVLDGLVDFTIVHKFNESNSSQDLTTKATLVINVYQDFDRGNACGSDFFNCYQPLCPNRCCSDHGTSGSKEEGRHEIYLDPWTSRKDYGKSRCIPKSLKCNENPNCGRYHDENIDERKEMCYAENFCPCQSICLTWNYVLTSLAIAILFIITPTAIVFALFHRRNVALERARLIRLAHARMAELRNEFTREGPVNDNPPTYDEVCDIKNPPPCFCQAIAMEMGMDALKFQEMVQHDTNCCPSRDADGNNETAANEIEMTAINNNNSNSNNAHISIVSNDPYVPTPNPNVTGIENLSFKCSCQSINQEIPPSYSSVVQNNNSEGNNDAQENTDEESRIRHSLSTNEEDDKTTNL